jgi:subtilase family serine protease
MKLQSLLHRICLLVILVGLSALTVLAQANAIPARVMQAVDLHNLVTLHGNVHPLARPEYDQGVAPDDLPMERVLLVLQRGADQEAALRQMLDDQQVKSSSRYHQWLTPEQFGQQFGPTDSDLQAVTGWLASQGFQVTNVSAGRTVIEFSGSAGLVRQVLGTEIHKFQVNGKDYWANTSDPQIPAALAPVVAGFASLNNFPRRPLNKNLGTFTRSKLTGEVQPLFTIPVDTCRDGGAGPCYYFAVGPWDFATIYNVAPLWSAGTDGTGQTIAVVGDSNIHLQDVVDFRSMFGLPTNAPNIILNGPDPGIQYDEDEADLDVQWSGAVAKGATIDFVVSESTETTMGIDLSALYIIDNNLAPVMSESFGVCEAYLGAGGNQFYSTLWEQAAAQGITVVLASGDSGSAACDRFAGETAAQYGLAVSGLASTPFNVAVGGTDFNDASDPLTYWNTTNSSPSQSSAKSYIPESTWNDSCADTGLLGCTPPPSSTYLDDGIDLAAGGGGASNCTNPLGTFPNTTCGGKYSKPSWQSGTGVPQDGARDIPDISMFAGEGLNFSFYITCQMDANASNGGNSSSCDLNAPYTDFQAGAGTSASAQVFAGVMAMVNQRYGRQGNANYVFYPMAAQNGASCKSSTAPLTNSSCVFYDVTVGNNSVICQGGTPNCSSTLAGQYGVMASGSSPAYGTTTGYDLATGLGSVNVANLVNNWKSNFTPSSITLALATNPVTNPITLTHGQPIDYTINVSSVSGTPSGDVSLIAQAGSGSNQTTGIGPFSLSAGSASGSTIMLPGGSYNVTAHYAGNGSLAASNSTPGIPVVVQKESSQTEVRLVSFSTTAPPAYNATSVPYGSPYYLRMDVTNSSGQLCASATTGLTSYPCPTGALAVSPAPMDPNPPSGTTAGSYTLNSQGYAEDQPIQQSPGTYNFVASYAGDNSYSASTSPTVPITITKAPTTTTFTGLQSTVIQGDFGPVAVNVNTTSNGAMPSCCVQFLINGSTVVTAGGTVSGTGGSASGYASLQASLYPTFPLGPLTVAAQFPGDQNYAGSTSAAVPVTVTDYTLTANPSSVNISAAGQTGTATLTITPLYGFVGTVVLDVAAGCPLWATCTVSPSSVTVSGASPVTATLSIVTVASVRPQQRSPRLRVPPSFRLPLKWPWLMAGLLALAILLNLTVSRRPARWFLIVALLAAGIWVACGSGGGGNTNNPPPSGTISFSSATISFGGQKIYTTSAPQTLTVRNTGQAPLAISVGLIGANTGDFSMATTCGNTLAVSANCPVNVTFTPTAVGSRAAAIVVNNNNTNDASPTVALSGMGIASAPAVTLSPPSLTFGPQKVGTTSPPQTITLSNTGNAIMNLASISVGGQDFAETNNCASSLAAGASCTITVNFTPKDVGQVSATLYLDDDAGSNTQYAMLNGTGTPATTLPGNYLIQVNSYIGGDEHVISVPVTVQ